MGQLRLAGSLDAGPPSASSESFPSSSYSVPLRFRETTKGYSVASGVLTARLASPGAFVALQGVGPGSPVTKAHLLYLKSDALLELRLTTDDGSGGSVVAVLPPAGFMLLELDATKYLKLLEAKGTATLEYLLCGNE